MNAQEREYFWKILCELDGKDVAQDANMLESVIKLPQFLYRYRPVTTQSLEALRTNRLYFSSSNYYDDPFDTFLYINTDAIRTGCESVFRSTESIETAVQCAQAAFGDMLTDEQRKQFTAVNIETALSRGLLDYVLAMALSLCNEIKKDTWSVCFSENGLNEVLWLKYAQQHKGFVLEYDLANEDNFLCGKQEKCKNCAVWNFGTPVYPMYYSDTPYDATNFARSLMMHKLETASGQTLPEKMKEAFAPTPWERERVTLIKKKCHEYDEEWRMIATCQMKPPVMREWIPSSITLGLRMDAAEEKLVIHLAKAAGIKSIRKSCINAKNQLTAVEIK